jgi:hypothetical protein
MKLTNFFHTGAIVLPTARSASNFLIASPADIKDDIRLTGKNSSDGEVTEMSRALYNPGEGFPTFCFDQHTAEYSLNCNDRPRYDVVEFVSFQSPTDQPRNLEIKTPGYNLSVSF